MIEPAIPTLYADVAEPLASALAESMLPHSLLAFTSPTTAPAWAESAFEGRRAYIRCTEDSCLPFDLQNAWLESCGVEWAIRDLEASHSAYISQPEAVAGLVSTFARQWAAPERGM
jgi:antirestriction protein